MAAILMNANGWMVRIARLKSSEADPARLAFAVILLLVVGVSGPALGDTSPVLGFHLAHKQLQAADLGDADPPKGYLLLPGWSEDQTPEVLEAEARLTHEHVKSAEFRYDKQTGMPVVALTLTGEGAERLKTLTTANVHRRMAIVLDGRVLTAPIIRETITGPGLHISGAWSPETATKLVERIRSAIRP